QILLLARFVDQLFLTGIVRPLLIQVEGAILAVAKCYAISSGRPDWKADYPPFICKPAGYIPDHIQQPDVSVSRADQLCSVVGQRHHIMRAWRADRSQVLSLSIEPHQVKFDRAGEVCQKAIRRGG